MSRQRAINEKEFDAIKLVLNKGSKLKETAELFGIPLATLRKVSPCDTYKDYEDYLTEMARKAREKYYSNKAKSEKVVTKPEKKEPVAMVTSFSDQTKSGGNQIILTSYQVNRLLKELEQQNEYLKLISAKLAFVVEQLS